MKFSCPHCGQHIDAEEDMVGMEVPCPTCSQKLTIPQPSDGSFPCASLTPKSPIERTAVRNQEVTPTGTPTAEGGKKAVRITVPLVKLDRLRRFLKKNINLYNLRGHIQPVLNGDPEIVLEGKQANVDSVVKDIRRLIGSFFPLTVEDEPVQGYPSFKEKMPAVYRCFSVKTVNSTYNPELSSQTYTTTYDLNTLKFHVFPEPELPLRLARFNRILWVVPLICWTVVLVYFAAYWATTSFKTSNDRDGFFAILIASSVLIWVPSILLSVWVGGKWEFYKLPALICRDRGLIKEGPIEIPSVLKLLWNPLPPEAVGYQWLPQTDWLKFARTLKLSGGPRLVRNHVAEAVDHALEGTDAVVEVTDQGEIRIFYTGPSSIIKTRLAALNLEVEQIEIFGNEYIVSQE